VAYNCSLVRQITRAEIDEQYGWRSSSGAKERGMTTNSCGVLAARLRLTCAAAATGMLCAAGLAAGAPAARANTTFDDAAAQFPAALYTPTAATAFRARVAAINGSQKCRGPAGPASTIALLTFTRLADRSQQFSVEEGSPQICVQDAPSTRVGTVRIAARRVEVDVFCGHSCGGITAADGGKRGYLIRLRRHRAGTTTAIQFTSRHITLSRAAKILSSLRAVNLKRPQVALHSFLTPDKRIWCFIAAPPLAEHEVVCGGLQPDLSASVNANGIRQLCNSGVQDATVTPSVCNQNFDFHAHVMRAGQDDQVSGFKCAVTATGVTCANLATGRGFLIDASSGVVSPA
jgi:hypothetical protein